MSVQLAVDLREDLSGDVKDADGVECCWLLGWGVMLGVDCWVVVLHCADCAPSQW